MQHIFSFDMFSSFSATQGLWPPPTCDMGYSKQDPLEELLELKDGDLGYLGWLDAHDESLKKESDEGRGSCDGWWLMVDGWWMVITIDHSWSWLIMMLHATIDWQELISKQTAARLELHETVASGCLSDFLSQAGPTQADELGWRCEYQQPGFTLNLCIWRIFCGCTGHFFISF